MINIDDLMEVKNEAEKYRNRPHSLVCHPANCESIYKYAEKISGRNLENPQMELHLFGMPIIALPSCPKDKVYILSKDMIDQEREAFGKILRGSLLND